MSFSQDLLFAQRAGADFPGPGDTGNSIALDDTGNVYVTGTMETGAVFGEGQPNETTSTMYGSFVAKYDNSGLLQWVQQIGNSTNYVTSLAIDVDGSGNSYITGRFTIETTLGAGQLNEVTLNGTSGEIFLAKYNSSGDLQWARSSGGLQDDPGGQGIVVSDDGKIYLTGTFWDTVTFGSGEANETTLVTTGTDGFLANYDTNGNLQWIKQIGANNSNDHGEDLDLDEAGNIYVVGDYFDSITFGEGLPNETVLDESNRSSFIAKFSSSGDFIWAIEPFSSGTADNSGDVKVDPNGDILITAQFTGTITLGFGEVNQTMLTGSGSDEILVAKYSSSGDFIWGKAASSSGIDFGFSIDVDDRANAYVTGYFSADCVFGSGEANETTVLNAGDQDMYLAKYANTGEFLWVASAGSSAWEEGTDVVVKSPSEIFVTGFYRGNVTFGASETNETTLNISGLNDMYIAKFQENNDVTFEEVLAGTFTSINSGSYAEVADYDNDGDYDILVTGFIGPAGLTDLYDNNGNGSFSLNATNPFADVFQSTLEWFDYNVDGYLDVVVMGNSGDVDTGNSVTKLYKNNGDGTFSEVLDGTFQNLLAGDVKAADFNNDGLPDLLIQGEQVDNGTTIEDVTKLYINKGNDEFLEANSPSTSPVYLETSFQGAFSWSDYDNDEDLDFYLSGSGDGYLAKLFENKNGSFSEVFAGTFAGVNSSDVITVDLNNSGFEDVVFSGQLTGNTTILSQIYENEGNAFSAGPPDVIEDIYNSSLSSGDLDGDGHSDIVITGTSGYMGPNHSSLYSGNGDFTISTLADGEIRPAQWGSIDPIDYDGDTDLDIFLAGSGTSLYRNVSNKTNSKPGNPTGLSVEVFAESIKFDWDASADVETPSPGLSYDIYLTDLSTGNMIVAPPSDTTNGFRRVIKKGSIKTTSWRLKRSLPEGNYRFGVQAVDASFAGGNFEVVEFTVPSGHISQGLVAYYPFSGNANDESGNGRNGNPGGITLTEDRFGNANSAYQFNGTNGSQIELGRNEVFSRFNGFTVAGWMKPEAGGQNIQYILQGSQVEIIFSQDTKNFQYNIFSEVGSLELNADLTGINFDEWAFFTATYDNTTAKFYVNGSLVESFTQASIDLNLQERGINIGGGGLANNNDLNFNGVLDDIRIYNRPLTEVEIEDLFNALSQQVPAITSFSPATGPVGTEVTITGTNFDPAIVGNSVHFGAIEASVTSASSDQLTVSVPSGATYQPISVLVNERFANSQIPFVTTFGGSSISLDSFEDKSDVNLSGVPYAIATADLDRDGKVDLILTNLTSQTVEVHRNTSPWPGTISFAPKVEFAVGTDPFSVAVGDIDADGLPDLVTANGGSNSVSVLLNTSSGSGSISFSAKQDFTAEVDPLFVAVGDVSNDGKLDIAVVNDNLNLVTIFRSTSTVSGDISFAPRENFIVGTDPLSVAIGDIDADGKNDLFISNAGNNTVSVLRNSNSGSSSLSFDAAQNFTTGDSPFRISIGDLDGDSNPDLAVLNNIGTSISVLRNTSPGPGSIDFADKVDFSVGDHPFAISISDMDGDAKPDLVAVNNGGTSLSLLHNTSSGPGNVDFSASVDLTTGAQPIGLTIADLDSDSKPDMAVTNSGDNSFSIFRNKVTTSQTETDIINIDVEGMIHMPEFMPLDHTANFTMPIGADITSLAPIFEVSPGAIIDPPTRSTQDFTNPVLYTVTAGDGVTSQIWTVTANLDSMFIAESILGIAPISISSGDDFIEFGDIDNDDDLDLIVSGTVEGSQSVNIYRNTNQQFVEIFADNVDALQSIFLELGDLDEDGDLDILRTGNNSTTGIIDTYDNFNGYALKHQLFQETSADRFEGAIFDFDNDGDLDIFSTGNSNKIFLNDGAGTGYPGSYDLTTVAAFTFIDEFDVGDFNRDGRVDLLVKYVTPTENKTAIWENTGGALVEKFSNILTINESSKPRWIDFDNDGDLDVVTTYLSGNSRIKLFENNSTSFVDALDIETQFVHPQVAEVADYNNDGKNDLLYVQSDGSNNHLLIYFNTGSGFSLQGLPDIAENFTSARSVDFDVDGDLDIVQFTNDGTFKVEKNRIAVSNAKPSAPTNLGTSISSNQVTFLWDKSFDDITPQDGLTYNIYIGGPLQDHVRPAHANLTNGFRKLTRRGEIQTNNWFIKDLPVGTYHWSVQAVDGGYIGSEFAAEQSFEVTNSVSTETDFISYSFPEQAASATPNSLTHTVDIEVPANTDITSLVSSFVLSAGATARIGSVTQVSGVTANDFSNPISYTITAEDGVTTQDWVVSVEVTNSVPIAINLSNDFLSENMPINTIVGSFSSEDSNLNDNHTYSLVAGDGDVDNGSFDIQNTNQLVNTEVFDFETRSSYNIRVRTDDGNGGIFEAPFTITIVDVDEEGSNQAPTDISLSNRTITENRPVSTQVGTLSTSDPDASDTHTYGLISGATSAFVINDGNSLESTEIFDFDDQSSYNVTIRTTDSGGLTVDKEFTIAILEENTNNPPTDIRLSNTLFGEGLSGGSNVGFFRTTDEDQSDSFTYTLVTGDGDTDNGSFTIAQTALRVSSELSAGTYSVRVQSSDGIDFISKKFTLSVIPVSTESVFKPGTTISDYRIFGVPTSIVRVNELFPNLRSEDEGSSWRIVGYNTETGAIENVFYNDLISGGKGYWHLNTKDVSMDAGVLSPINLNANSEYSLDLKAGWNLIANPFLEELNWSDVISRHISEGVIIEGNITPDGIYTYNGAYNVSSSLDVFEGGWISIGFAVTLTLPNQSATINGRKAVPNEFPIEDSWIIDETNWQLIVHMTDGVFSTNLAGIGMKPGAKDQEDHFDLRSPPKIAEEIDFGLKDSYGLSRNYVSPGINKEWVYSIGSTENEHVVLSWDKELVATLPHNLYLYVPHLDRTFNMQAISELSLSSGQKLKIIYGDNIDHGTLDLQTVAYPNPVDQEVTFQFFVDGPKELYEVSALIYGVDGKLVQNQKALKASDQMGIMKLEAISLPSGLYFYQIAYGDRKSSLKKLIIK